MVSYYDELKKREGNYYLVTSDTGFKNRYKPLLNEIGICKSITMNESEEILLGLEFARYKNENSSKNLFWIKETNLRQVSGKTYKEMYGKGEKGMAKKNTVELLGGYTCVGVIYMDSTNTCEYVFACYDEVKEGYLGITDKDKVVEISRVYTEKDHIPFKPTAQLIGVVNPNAFNKREERLADKMRKLDALRKCAEETSELMMFQQMASVNPAMAKLLKEYEAI